MKTHNPNKTRIIFMLIILALITAILIFKQPSHTGSAVEATGQLITSTETVNVFVNPTTHEVHVIKTSPPYTSTQYYSPYGQLLREESAENNQQIYTLTYHYNGNPMSGTKTLLSLTDSIGVTKEHLEFNDQAYPAFPTLTKISVPLTPSAESTITLPPSLDIYIGYKYTYIQHLQKTLVNGWYGSAPDELQQTMASKPSNIRYLLSPENNILIMPDFTKTIEIIYTLFDGQTKYPTSMKTVTNNKFVELLTYTYDNQHRIHTVNIQVDMTNDGTFEEDTMREFFYNQNDLPIKYADTYFNGNTRTYDFNWDRQDKYAVLLGITGPNGPLITGNTYGHDGFIPLTTDDLFRI